MRLLEGSPPVAPSKASSSLSILLYRAKWGWTRCTMRYSGWRDLNRGYAFFVWAILTASRDLHPREEWSISRISSYFKGQPILLQLFSFLLPLFHLDNVLLEPYTTMASFSQYGHAWGWSMHASRLT